jgi:DNA-directed RNA polymerase-3 subunit RPC5
VREPELMGALGADAASVDGAVCLRATGDPKSDPFRGFLIEMLRARGRVVRRTEVMEGAAAALGAPPSNAVYMRCLGELCVSRGSTWVMKTGA